MKYAKIATLVVSVAAVIGSFTAASADEDSDVAIAFDQLEWNPWGNTPVEIAVLWGDPAGDDFGVLLKLPHGFTPGPHGHTGHYHGINLTGEWVHIFGDNDVRSLPPGSYVGQPGGAEHNDACASEGGCVIFIHQHTPQDFLPPEGLDR